MRRFDPEELASWCNGRWLGCVPPGISGICHDTRKLEAGDLYIAIRGERFDGHEFVPEAGARQACGAVVETPEGAQALPLLVVNDTRRALADIARAYRRKINPFITGITGTSGKSTVKEMLTAILSSRFKVAGTCGNWNNDIGLPMSLLQMTPDCEVGVFEVGTNHPGEIAALCKILEPTRGIVTNIGAGHIEHFGTVDAIAEEKACLLKALPSDGLAIFDEAGPYRALLKAASTAPSLTVGFRDGADLVGVHAAGRLQVRERATGETFTFDVPVPGQHNQMNALMAIAAARAYGMSWEEIQSGFAAYQPLSMRGDIHQIGGRVIVNDAYNANPVSMRASLTSFCEQMTGRRRWLVLGDMYELGVHSKPEHEALGVFVGSLEWQGLVAIGEFSEALAGAVQAAGPGRSLHCCQTLEGAANILASETKQGDAILLKASRGVGLERIVELLTEVLGG